MNDQIDQWLKKEGLASSSSTSKKKDSPPRSNQSQNQKKSAPRDKNKPKTNNRLPNSHSQKRANPPKNTHSSAPKRARSNAPSSHSASNKKRPPSGSRTISSVKFPRKNAKFSALSQKNPEAIHLVSLGGLEEVGQNMMMLEWGPDIILIDMGIAFNGERNIGVDAFLPDISYLQQHKDRIRGVLFTHGHLDHIGAVPHLIPSLGYPPLYASPLCQEIIKANSHEYQLEKKLKFRSIQPGKTLSLGRFTLEFFAVNHSIPESMGIAIQTPGGYLIHTGDFKFDPTPSDRSVADIKALERFAQKGVLLAMVDSTDALTPGTKSSEAVVDKNLEEVLKKSPARVFVATFASCIGRIMRLIEAAERSGRTVFLAGRSMRKNVELAQKLGLIKCRKETIQILSPQTAQTPPEKSLVLCTGSQGEENAALTRLAAGVHPLFQLSRQDLVIFSASFPIPGNDLALNRLRNDLAVKEIPYWSNSAEKTWHVGGHANTEDCLRMTRMLKPQYFAPIHGEPYMRYGHAELVMKNLNFPRKNCILMHNGRGIQIAGKTITELGRNNAFAPHGRPLQMGYFLTEETVDQRRKIGNFGVMILNIKQHQGRWKSLETRLVGFPIIDDRHQVFKRLPIAVKALFEEHFSAARPLKVAEKSIRQGVKKMLLSEFHLSPYLEVVIS